MKKIIGIIIIALLISGGVYAATRGIVPRAGGEGTIGTAAKHWSTAYIDTITGNLTGNANTATALSANGANCNAGEYALGVNASGAVESCTDATTEINTIVATKDECSEITNCVPSAWDALTDMVLADTYLYVGNVSNDPVGVIMSNDCTMANTGAITCDHDALTNFVANEHIDWTTDQGATNIHAGNYTDTNTTYLGGTNLTLVGTTFNVDDAFLINSGSDIAGGGAGFTWAFNASAGVDSVLTFGDGTINVSTGALQVGGVAVQTGTDLTDDTVSASELTIDYGEFTCNGTTCVIDADTIALTTDTTGNYAAGDAEAGNATGLACTNCVAGTEIALGSDAQGDVMYYNGTDYARLGYGTAGYALTTGGVGANPSWTAVGVGDVTAVGNCASGLCFDGSSDGGTYLDFYDAQGAVRLITGDVAGAITLTLPITTGTLIHSGVTTLSSLTSIGTIATGTWQSTDIGVSYGGTGLSDPTDHSVLVGSGNTAITALTVGTNGQILVGSAGADPVFATLTCDDGLTCTTGAGTLEIDVDADVRTDTKCIYIEDPTAGDDLKSFWTNNGFAVTIIKIWCESDQADGVQLDLQIDDGSPADVAGTDLDCDDTPAEDEAGLTGAMADGDRLDMVITSVGGAETWLSVCWTFTIDD